MAKEKVFVDEQLCVKEILKERKIKMKEFAVQIGITPESLTRALQGNPQYSTLKTIADALGLSVRDLFRGEDAKDDKEMRGCIFYNNEMFTFNTRQDLEEFLKQN